jgi:hypothetical protein
MNQRIIRGGSPLFLQSFIKADQEEEEEAANLTALL